MSSAEDTPSLKPAAARKPRPLSPHAMIYKWPFAALMSGTHRATGAALCAGTVLFVVWLACLARGPESYNAFLSLARTWVGQFVLLGFSFAFFYHLCNGIRHLLWDIGMYLDLESVNRTGRITIVAAVLLTAVAWLKVYYGA